MAYGTVNAEQMTTQSGYTLGAGNSSSFKNRVINGNFLINQRNGTNAVTTSALQTATYFSDRWYYYVDQTSKLSFTQSTDAPAGFTSSNLVTVLATDSVGPEQMVRQAIEGYNIADLGWGTANAKPVVLSFWVKSSITGTFGGSLQSNNSGASYPFLYTVNATNTWEQKFVYVTGPTTGSFGTTNNTGALISFEFGPGYQATAANAWTATNTTTATGASNFCANSGATIRLTGVQFEVGTVATSFDYRPIGQEYLLCQRYYWQQTASPTSYAHFAPAVVTGASSVDAMLQWLVTMRTQPTITFTAASTFLIDGAGSQTPSAISVNFITNTNARVSLTVSALTSGQGTFLGSGGGGAAAIYYSAEL